MTEVLFYHLQNMSLESVLPPLLEKSLERGWRVVVQSTSPERTRRSMRICGPTATIRSLPHATWRVGDAQDQPIILSIEEATRIGPMSAF
jgi:DNA polymerase-3 subunit chi